MSNVRTIEAMGEEPVLELPDTPTQELIRKLWQMVPPTARDHIRYESLNLGEAVRLEEVLHPEVADGTVEPKHWVESAPYTNGIFEKRVLQTGGITSDNGGWKDTLITPFETQRRDREIDLMTILEDRAARRLLSTPTAEPRL